MPRQGLTRERVVAEAAALVDEPGAQLSFTALATRLGVRPPSLYKHVDGLGALHSALAVMALVELTDSLRRAVSGRSGRDALHACGMAYRGYAREHPGRYAFTIRAPSPGDDAHATAAAGAVDVLRATLRELGPAHDETTHAIRTVRSALHGFVTIEAAGGFGLELDRDASFERLLDVLWVGLVGAALT